MFPEGTRSRGRGMLPFKTGAFHAAMAAGVPVVPVCVSTTQGRIKLNRWNNGVVIVEMLPPVDTSKYTREQVRELAEDCRQMMIKRIAELDKEVIEMENKRAVKTLDFRDCHVGYTNTSLIILQLIIDKFRNCSSSAISYA